MKITESVWIWFSLCGYLAAVGAGAQEERPLSEPPSDYQVFDEVAVVEKELLVEFPDLDRSAEELSAEDLWLTEGGEVREVLGVFPLTTEREARFSIEVVFDGSFLSPNSAALARATLLAQADRLVALGPVGLWFMDDEGVAQSPKTRSAADFSERLMARREIAGTRLSAARQRAKRAAFLEGAEERVERAGARLTTERLVAQSLTRLASLAVTGCSVPPCILILVSDGFLRRDEARSLVDSETLGKTLAAYGWTAFTLALSEPPEKPDYGEPPRPSTDFEEWTKERGGVSVGRSQIGRKSRLANLDVDAYDVYVLPRYEALRDWGRMTGGAIAARAHQVAGELGRLGRHYRLRYRSVAEANARLIPVEVGFRDESPFVAKRRLARVTGFAREKVLISAPGFARSGWPLAAEVRLGDLLTSPASVLRRP